MNNNKEFREKFKTIWIKRCGDIEDLKRSIGKDWLDHFLQVDFIRVDKYFNVWKITDKGNLYGVCHYLKGNWFLKLIVKVLYKIIKICD